MYLIHAHPLIWEHWLAGRFAFLADKPPILLASGVLGGAFAIYAVCSLADVCGQAYSACSVSKRFSRWAEEAVSARLRPQLWLEGVTMERHIFSVTEVNELVKLLLDNEPMLSGICVRGEISNYKMYPSGHHYFFPEGPHRSHPVRHVQGAGLRLRFRPENGMKVLVTGRVSVFPRDGAYQLYCDTMTPEGAGDLARAFEQLKEQLYKEGLLMKPTRSRLPRFPERIAVVTSSAGAAVHDMIRILRRRYPSSQGDLAARAGSRGGGPAGDRGGHPVRRQVEDRRRHHHRPGRRVYGGPVGLQR